MRDTPFVTEDGQTVNYQEYLHTQTWERKRQEAFIAYEGECLMCAKALVFCGIWNVHHKHYRNIGHEPIRDLVLLCYGCHKAYHDGLDLRRPASRRRSTGTRSAGNQRRAQAESSPVRKDGTDRQGRSGRCGTINGAFPVTGSDAALSPGTPGINRRSAPVDKSGRQG